MLPLVMPTVLKLLAALFKVMLLAAPTARAVVPVTLTAPLWVKGPPVVVTLKVPDTVEAPRFSAVASVSATLLPLVMPTVLKLLAAFVRVISLVAPAVKVVKPAAVTAPVCVMAPVDVMASVPVEVVPAFALTPVAPIVTGPVSAQAMLPPVKFTWSKLLAGLVNVMLPRFPAVPPRSVTVNVRLTPSVTGALCVRL